MWSHSHTLECPAAPEVVWSVYADTASWSDWNPSIESLALDGPFARGTTGLLTPRGQEPLPFTLVSVEPGHGYVSETAIAETVTMRTEIVLTPSASGTRIESQLSMHGAAAEFFGDSFGPAFAAGVPATMQATADRAVAVAGSASPVAS